MMGILAAALAEDSKFDEAASCAQFASNLALQNGDTNSFQMNQALLQLYQNKQPYHAPPAPAQN
jgi:hypothetical protein